MIYIKSTLAGIGARNKFLTRGTPQAKGVVLRLHRPIRKRMGWLLIEVPPVPSITLEQFFGVLRTPSAGRIIGEIARRQGLPKIQHRTDDAPSGFYHVGTLK